MSSRLLFPILTLVLPMTMIGCGVKGRPLPPLNPAPIGDGTLKGQKKKTPSRPNTAPSEEKALGGK